jgi:hypothetical protein
LPVKASFVIAVNSAADGGVLAISSSLLQLTNAIVAKILIRCFKICFHNFFFKLLFTCFLIDTFGLNCYPVFRFFFVVDFLGFFYYICCKICYLVFWKLISCN